MTIAPDRPFRLGTFTVRPRLGELSGPDGDVRLEPKVMGVLVCLAMHAGEAVTREQFVAAVWDGRPVTDEVLSRCISILRKQFADDPLQPKYIQTVHKVGYRLLESVSWLDVPTPGAEPPPVTAAEPPVAAAVETTQDTIRPRDARPARPLRLAMGTLAVLAALALTVLTWQRFAGEEPAPATGDPALPTIAVLPFKNLGGEDNEPLRDGLTEDLINTLANLPELRVIGSTSMFVYKNRVVDVRDVARDLGADFVLQGSMRKDDQRVRINAALIDAEDRVVRWSSQFDRAFSDYFAIQDDISRSIVSELLPELTGRELQRVNVPAPTEVMSAYELVLRGRYHLRKRDEESILLGIELFQQATELDPDYGEAWRDLARAYALLPTYSYEDPVEMFDLADAALTRSVAVDPDMDLRVNDVRAFLHFARWEWVEAEKDFRKALEHTPNDANLHQWYSQQLAAVGKLDEALAEVRKARQLDLLSPVMNQRLAVVYQWNDDDERAKHYFDLASELGLGPRANPESYAVQLLRRHEYDAARDVLVDLQRAFSRASQWIDPFIAALQDPSRRPEALRALKAAAEERQIALKYLQGAYAFLGDGEAAIDVAFDLLQDPVEFEVEFFFARENAVVRAQPRFGELVRAIGLDAYWDEYGWPSFCRRAGNDIECH